MKKSRMFLPARLLYLCLVGLVLRNAGYFFGVRCFFTVAAFVLRRRTLGKFCALETVFTLISHTRRVQILRADAVSTCRFY